jgi:hypothetical protein
VGRGARIGALEQGEAALGVDADELAEAGPQQPRGAGVAVAVEEVQEGGAVVLGEGADEAAVAGPDGGLFAGGDAGEGVLEVVADDLGVAEVEAAPVGDGVGEGGEVGAQGAVLEDR